MATARLKTRYPASTLVVTVLALVFTATYLLKRAIPEPDPSALSAVPGEFVQAGTRQEVLWRQLEKGAFIEARRRDRPVLMLLGSMASRASRRADALGFTNKDNAERLRQQFVSVRVDLVETPQWASTYVPIIRASMGVDAATQLVFLDPSGRIFNSFMPGAPGDVINNVALDMKMSAALQLLAQIRNGDKDVPAAGSMQVQDLALMRAPGSISAAKVHDHAEWLSNQTDVRSGGFQTLGFRKLQPFRWRCLLQASKLESLRASLDPVLASPIVDWLDGGFFRMANRPGWHDVEYDKLAIDNAEMAALLAQMWLQTREPVYRRIAVQTFDALTSQFTKDGLVAAYRQGDEVDTSYSRSARSSFSPRLLRQNFSRAERQWLSESFGLKVEENIQMSLKVPQLGSLEPNWDQYERYLERLRSISARVEPTYGGFGLAYVNGRVCARLLETARLLGDAERTKAALELYKGVKTLLSGEDDVLHSTSANAGHAYLGDYLAVADAALQAYLVRGSAFELAQGARLLARARELFASPLGRGMLLNSLEGELAQWMPDVELPNLTDDVGESTAAQAIRLFFSYGSLMRNSSMRQFATDGLNAFATAAERLQAGVSGYFSAAWLSMQPVVVVKGPTAATRASSLAPKLPLNLVVPAVGQMASSLEGRPDGVYLLSGGSLEGPISAADAVRRMQMAQAGATQASGP